MVKYEDERDPYERIAAEIRAQIMSGMRAPGDVLPSNTALADEFGTSGATIQKALRDLKREGWIEGRAGLNRTVRARQVREITAGAYFDPTETGVTYDILEVREVEPVGDVAAALGGERAILRHRLMKDPKGLLEADWSYYPVSIAAGTPLALGKKIRGGAPRVMAELGLPERRFADVVSARAATEYEADLLELPRGVPVLRILRTMYSDDDRVVAATVLIKATHLLAQRYEQATSGD